MSDENAAPVIQGEQEEVDLNASNSDSREEAKQPLNDDLFFSTISDPNTNDEADDKKEQETSKKEDMDEIFKINSPPNSSQQIKLTDDEEDDPFDPSQSGASKTKASELSGTATAAASAVMNGARGKSPEVKHTSFDDVMIEDEDKDKFLDISLSDPTKVGEGMSSYMVYKLTCKTNFPMFKKTEFGATRRFSDFLSLYEKLKEKHLAAGRVLPPAPEKDMLGTAKVKMSKEETPTIDFIGKRRAALERFLNRLGKHKTFRYDPDFRDFLEIESELPKATNTSALSGAGMVKMFKNLTDSVSKISIKIEESDPWFEEKTRQVDNLQQQFTKLHSSIELLYGWRKNLAASSNDFSKSTAILANSEEQLSLSRALSTLGEIYEKIDMIYSEQANSDYYMFGEMAKDYMGLLDNIRDVLHQRIKVYTNWKKAEETLKLKIEAKTKLEAANKQDKLPTALAEIRDWETKVEKGGQDFEQISKTIKEEMKVFDFNRVKEFKVKLVQYLENLLGSQEQLVTIWDQYLPQVKAI